VVTTGAGVAGVVVHRKTDHTPIKSPKSAMFDPKAGCVTSAIFAYSPRF